MSVIRWVSSLFSSTITVWMVMSASSAPRKKIPKGEASSIPTSRVNTSTMIITAPPAPSMFRRDFAAARMAFSASRASFAACFCAAWPAFFPAFIAVCVASADFRAAWAAAFSTWTGVLMASEVVRTLRDAVLMERSTCFSRMMLARGETIRALAEEVVSLGTSAVVRFVS